jgi:hypothetical protein
MDTAPRLAEPIIWWAVRLSVSSITATIIQLLPSFNFFHHFLFFFLFT